MIWFRGVWTLLVLSRATLFLIIQKHSNGITDRKDEERGKRSTCRFKLRRGVEGVMVLMGFWFISPCVFVFQRKVSFRSWTGECRVSFQTVCIRACKAWLLNLNKKKTFFFVLRYHVPLLDVTLMDRREKVTASWTPLFGGSWSKTNGLRTVEEVQRAPTIQRLYSV